jgi:2'-5' RNA ligase
VFFGLSVPEAQREALASHLAVCAAIAPAFRWVPPDNLHLTVRFLGSVERAVADGIAERLAAASLPAFEVELGDAGVFRHGRRVRVVWIGLRSGVERAREVAARVEAECATAGLEPDTRAFRPHLTLARSRRINGDILPALPPAPQLEPWRAQELVLFRSHLGRAGAVYEPLRSLRLG